MSPDVLRLSRCSPRKPRWRPICRSRRSIRRRRCAMLAGLQLDRLLYRRQWRRRLGPFVVERARHRHQCLGRPGRRHRRLQLAVRQHRTRSRRRYGLVALKRLLSSTFCSGCSVNDNWLSTVRGRAGYAFGGVLPYVTGGLAVGDINATVPGLPAPARPMPAGPSAAASKSRCRKTGAPRPNICTSISATSIAASTAARSRPTMCRCMTTSCAPA